jgi:hypothetical protein
VTSTHLDSTATTKKRAAIGFVAGLILTLSSIFMLRWQPRADFDVTGVLWLMQNAVPLIVFSISFVIASGAGIVWLQCKRREARRRG